MLMYPRRSSCWGFPWPVFTGLAGLSPRAGAGGWALGGTSSARVADAEAADQQQLAATKRHAVIAVKARATSSERGSLTTGFLSVSSLHRPIAPRRHPS